MIPLVHDLSGETVLVFGGGNVATRKAKRFVSEARLIVVSPTFSDELRSLAEDRSLELVRDAPDPDGVRELVDRISPALIVAATDDPAVNAAAEAEAHECGVLVNRTDVSGARDSGSVVVPATVEDGPVTVAITTGANSPALARHLRERIEAEIEGAGELARITGDLRTELAEREVPPEGRREALRAVVRSPDVWKALQVGGANPRQTARRVAEGTCTDDGIERRTDDGTRKS